MKVHLIKKQSIEVFVIENAQAKVFFETWLAIIKSVDWEIPQDIVSTFGNADILGKGSERVVFNIGGNKYRMVCKYYFGVNRVHLFIKWIGSHAKYSRLCKQGKQFEIDDF